jgi:hypothetical protein
MFKTCCFYAPLEPSTWEQYPLENCVNDEWGIETHSTKAPPMLRLGKQAMNPSASFYIIDYKYLIILGVSASKYISKGVRRL